MKIYRYINLQRRLLAMLFCTGIIAGGSGNAEELLSAPPQNVASSRQVTSERAAEIALRAMGMLGIDYLHGGDSPQEGMDCSGLVGYVFQQAWRLSLPRTSHEISQIGMPIALKNLQAGDLVFYNTMKRKFSHVGIYVGDNKFIHAPSKGGQVRIESMEIGYWKRRFNGARRMPDPMAVESHTAHQD